MLLWGVAKHPQEEPPLDFHQHSAHLRPYFPTQKIFQRNFKHFPCAQSSWSLSLLFLFYVLTSKLSPSSCWKVICEWVNTFPHFYHHPIHIGIGYSTVSFKLRVLKKNPSGHHLSPWWKENLSWREVRREFKSFFLKTLQSLCCHFFLWFAYDITCMPLALLFD